MHRDDLTDFLTTYLRTGEYDDYGPNGLQVEGRNDIVKVVTAVSASVDLFKEAIARKADTVIVHHGIIWNFERPLYQGGYRERVRLLLEHNINLYGFHLPLDAHEEVGNNAQLCGLLGVKNIQPFGNHKGQVIGMRGEIKPRSKEVFFKQISEVVGREPVVFDFGPDQIKTVGIVSGDALKEIKQAVDAGLDIYITGEVSEHIMHYAKEEKIHFVSAGHYATEKFGIIALGQLLEDKFDLDVSFIDIPNPV